MKLFRIWLLFAPIVNCNQIQWNPTFFMTSFIARISLFGSFKFTQTRVLEKLVKKLMKKEIINFEPLYRFQPNARPTKLRRNYTCKNVSSIAWHLWNLECFEVFLKKTKLENTNAKAEDIQSRRHLKHTGFQPDSWILAQITSISFFLPLTRAWFKIFIIL